MLARRKLGLYSLARWKGLYLRVTALPPKADHKPGGDNACDHADPQRDKDAGYSDLDAQHKPQQVATCHHR